MGELVVKNLSGPEVQDYLDDLARLRMQVFRDFPYLYAGSMDYERKYLQTYVQAPESVFVLAFDGDRVVGASTGMPMEYEHAEFQAPFIREGYDIRKVFYCAESVLLKSHRGHGLYPKFFDGREGYARRLGRFEWTTFCAVQRPADHPRRPPDYTPLDGYWSKRGYVRHPELTTTYSWKDLDETEESPKPMVFWLKRLEAES